MRLPMRHQSAVAVVLFLVAGACSSHPNTPGSDSGTFAPPTASNAIVGGGGGGAVAMIRAGSGAAGMGAIRGVAAGSGGTSASALPPSATRAPTSAPDATPNASSGAGAGATHSAGSGAAGNTAVAGTPATTSAGMPKPVSGTSGAGSMTGGAAGTAAHGGGPSMSAENPSKPPCETSPDDTVVIGDSYINWASHTLPADLADQAGEMWPLYAVGGASMATGGIAELIPDQFSDALADNPNIKFVVMDGGGNDVLIPDASFVGGGDCKNSEMAGSLPVCQQIVKQSFDAAAALFKRMAGIGVRDVLFFFYPHVPTNTPIGGDDPNPILDYSLPIIKNVCDDTEMQTGGKLRCHFVDMIPVFEGHDPDWFAAGDIHPNSDGSAAMAKAIWGTMKKACMSQQASSGCCSASP